MEFSFSYLWILLIFLRDSYKFPFSSITCTPVRYCANLHAVVNFNPSPYPWQFEISTQPEEKCEIGNPTSQPTSQ